MTNLDIANMSATELAKLLAVVRAAEKAKASEIAALPTFAYLVVTEDNKFIQWSGKADTAESAIAMAKVYVAESGNTFFDICKRPIPQARGRKVKAIAEGEPVV